MTINRGETLSKVEDVHKDFPGNCMHLTEFLTKIKKGEVVVVVRTVWIQENLLSFVP